ncbi:MAG: hypothetical protein HYZ74_08125 [Elusimicrobia bacterium]|nr:hypothetical protein [Elusimicrobiota bacterium]
MNIPASLALTAVLVAGGAWAQNYAPLDPPAQTPDLAEVKHEMGIVMAVDAKSGRLAVKSEDGKTKRFFAKRAKVTAEGKTVSLADLSIGDRVSLSHKVRGVTEIVRLHQALKR